MARDSKSGKAAPVNRLVPETEKEKQLFNEREARDKLRKRKREEQKKGIENGFAHFFRGEEADRLRNLLAEGRVFCDFPALADRNSILLRDTRLENALICQPQQRNLHGRIFGGFLMHRAFELGFSTAYAFVGHMPSFLEVDHVDFLKPVSASLFLVIKLDCFESYTILFLVVLYINLIKFCAVRLMWEIFFGSNHVYYTLNWIIQINL